MTVIQAPGPIPKEIACIFLAGSIEIGAAENWQQKVIRRLQEQDSQYVILNPRRDDWDSSWEEKISNPQFNEQVNWELQGLEQAQLVLMYFDPATKSPITLFELGLIAQMDPKKLIVVCPAGFWRKGNVDVVCERYHIRTATTIEDALAMVPTHSQDSHAI